MITAQELEKKIAKLEASKNDVIEKKNAETEKLDKKFEEMKNRYFSEKKEKLSVFDEKIRILDNEILKNRKAIDIINRKEEELNKLLG